MRHHICALILFCTVAPGAGLHAQAAGRAAAGARIDSLVNATRVADRTPGITVAVVQGADTIVLRGYGEADVENSVPVTAESVFYIASVTKQFTAAAVMKLVEQGRIRLDATVGDYLTDYQGPARRVTIHQLLTHTGGVPNYTDPGPRAVAQGGLPSAHEQIVALWATDSLAFEPGSRWEYSNAGYYMLGMIIEQVTGRRYAEHMREAVWQPLGLGQTHYCAGSDVIPHRARAYWVHEGVLLNAQPVNAHVPFAAGALCSTPRDLVRWTRALHTGRVVAPESFAAMIRPVSLSDGRTHPYGYGFTLARLGDAAAVQHGGGINGFSANLVHYPAHDLTIAVIVNGPTSSSTLAQRIAYLVLDIPDPATADLPTTAEQRARYAGNYDFAPAAPIQVRVFEQDGRLFAQATGTGPLPLRYLGENTFSGPAGAGITFVFTLTGDRVTGLAMPRNGGITGRRID